MAQFNLNDYETVQERITRFYDKYPSGRIITSLESPMTDLKTVVFKAELYLKQDIVSTGWAFEVAGQGFVNKTSHLENCETSAIGRALANFNLHGDKRVSSEEMEKVKRMESEQNKEEDEIKKMRERLNQECQDVEFRGYLIGEGYLGNGKPDDSQVKEIYNNLSSLKRAWKAGK